MQKKFDIPGFTYFAEKNNYTGRKKNIYKNKITKGKNITEDV